MNYKKEVVSGGTRGNEGAKGRKHEDKTSGLHDYKSSCRPVFQFPIFNSC